MSENKKEEKRLSCFREDFDINDRFMKQDYVKYNNETFLISTVDLGLDHNFFDEGDPIYWETMIFKKESSGSIDFTDLYCMRYTSLEAAIENHERIVQAFETKPEDVEFSDYHFTFKWEN